MRTTFFRSAILIFIPATASLMPWSLLAQVMPRPRATVAPRPIERPITPDAIDAPIDIDVELSRDLAMTDARIALDRVRAVQLDLGSRLLDLNIEPMLAPMIERSVDAAIAFAPRARMSLPESPRAPWAQADPADSLYRIAREALNAGEYRRAAQLFAQISQQFPTSQYRSDANYWRAFALYRIGGLADLREALQALDSAGAISARVASASATSDARSMAISDAIARGQPSARAFIRFNSRSSDSEAAVLAMRIRGALAARGDVAAAAQVARTADGSATSCDDEDAQLRVEALNALVQMDPKNAEPAITKVLARRDACAAPLRRGALALVARSNDAHTTDLLISTAKTDPAIEVRAEAIRLLGRAPDDRATATLTEIATSSDKPPLQRIAVRALATQESPASRQSIRSLMTRTDLPTDVRITALHYAGRSDLQVADLAKMYDASADRSTRDEIISLLEQREEPAAADKLIDIARASTDPSLRRRAIEALTRKHDPRTAKLLTDILDK